MAREYRNISGDSHLEIPCDFWTPRVPEKYRDRAPRRIKLPSGGDGFIGEGVPLIYGGTGHFAGKTPEEFDPLALDFDEAAGSGGPEQRIKELDADGLDAEVLFPSPTANRVYRNIRDRDTYVAVIRAYNDYLAEDFCSHAPDRFFGVAILPDRGVDDDIAEMEHCAKLGLKAVVLSIFPGGKNFPTAEDDRFWAAAIDMDVLVTVHTQMSHSRNAATFDYARKPEGEQKPPNDYIDKLYRHGQGHCGAMEAVQMAVFGVFERFPKLNVYWAENQIGWLPFYYEQMDLAWEVNRFWAERIMGVPQLPRRPSEYIREHAYWGFFEDPIGLKLRNEIGLDRIIWSSDFPHETTRWPHSLEVVDEQMQAAGVQPGERHKIMAGNMLQLLGMGE